MSRQRLYGSGLLRVIQQINCRQNGCALPVQISGRSHRPSYKVGGQQDPWQGHHAHSFFEHPAGNDNSGDAGLFKEPGNVSHGHVAYRSDGYQDGGINTRGKEFRSPFGAGSFQQAHLRAGPDKRVGVWCQATDFALLFKCRQDFKRKSCVCVRP